jgi:TPR repeat protein
MHTSAVLSLLVVFSAFVTTASAAPCQEPKLESLSGSHPECHLFKGTRHFRAKEYSAASHEWLAVVDAKDMPKEFEHLRVDAQNNLGYLFYMGWGVKQDRERAMQQYWLPADKAGHEEAAYHLCHAYAEDNSRLALGYCREALRRYGKIESAESGEVVAQLRRYISRLEGR